MDERQITVSEAPGVVASVERIDAWLHLAKAGDRFVYASRATLPVSSPGAARMRALADRGLVHLFRPRSPLDPELFNYTAERSSVRMAGAKQAKPVLSLPIIDAEAAAIDALLPVLERFAQAGRPCPTDAQLAERTGIDREAIPAALDALRAARLIRVQPAPAPTLRRVLILTTGALTGLVA